MAIQIECPNPDCKKQLNMFDYEIDEYGVAHFDDGLLHEPAETNTRYSCSHCGEDITDIILGTEV